METKESTSDKLIVKAQRVLATLESRYAHGAPICANLRASLESGDLAKIKMDLHIARTIGGVR